MVAKEGVHADRLGRGQIQILQDPAVFKFTVDPILVADFLRANPGIRSWIWGPAVALFHCGSPVTGAFSG